MAVMKVIVVAHLNMESGEFTEFDHVEYEGGDEQDEDEEMDD